MTRELMLPVPHLNSDRHVFVTSHTLNDISFGTNFAQASTYRATLTRHASDADLDQTAPRVTELDNDYDSIELTFSEAVCGSPETGCAALTADHFEVVHYVGDVSSAELATLLTISTVTLTGDSTNGYTVAVLDIDLDSAPEIDGDDYLLVRTARNSRFTDNFITDRTIFRQTQTIRTVPRTAETYSEAASGMLHLQSGALLEAIPVITYTVAGNSISEGGSAERNTATFTITRAPEDVKFATNVTVTITRTGGDDDPDDFSVDFAGTAVTGDGVWTEVITFLAGEDEKTIEISFTGNDVGTGDRVYEIALTLPAGARSAVGSISTFTIEEDDNTAPAITLVATTIYETAVELDDDNVRDFDSMTAYENRSITQLSQLFSSPDTDITDGPNSTTYTKVVVMLSGEEESSRVWTLTNGGDANFGDPVVTTTPGDDVTDGDLIYTYTPLSEITDITDIDSFIKGIEIQLKAAEFPGIDAADGTRTINVVLEVFEAQSTGTDLVGRGFVDYTLQAENDLVQYIRPEDSEASTITGTLAGDNLAITVVLEEPATTTEYTGSLGFFTDGEGSGASLTFDPEASSSGDLSLINQAFPTTDSTEISATELEYGFGVAGGSFGTAGRSITVRDGDGSSGTFTFTVVVTERILIFRIKVFIEGAL